MGTGGGGGGRIQLPVPYFCQRDSATAQGNRMRFSSTCARSIERASRRMRSPPWSTNSLMPVQIGDRAASPCHQCQEADFHHPGAERFAAGQ